MHPARVTRKDAVLPLPQHPIYGRQGLGHIFLAEAPPGEDLDVAREGVEREGVVGAAERIVELVADRVEAEEGIRDEEDDHRREGVHRVDEAERQLIMATLIESSGNKRRAAALLGCSIKTLYNKLQHYRATGAGSSLQAMAD